MQVPTTDEKRTRGLVRNQTKTKLPSRDQLMTCETVQQLLCAVELLVHEVQQEVHVELHIPLKQVDELSRLKLRL